MSKARPGEAWQGFFESEKVFLGKVVKAARLNHWLVAHFRPGLTKRGNWVTAVQGDGAGFPDLVLCKPPRVIFAELKSEIGKVSNAQRIWIDALAKSGSYQVEVHIWRPKDFDVIWKILRE